MREEKKNSVTGVVETENSSTGKMPSSNSAAKGFLLPSDAPRSGSRRKFLGNVRGAAMAAATVGVIGLEHSIAHAEQNGGLIGTARADESQEIRINAANHERAVRIPNQPTNGDQNRYADQANTYTKGLPHDSFGRVDLNAFSILLNALNTGEPEDFEKIIVGGTRRLNGPQGGYAFDLEGTDAYQFGFPLVPPAPALASDLNAAELLEHYWASLLRDVPFTQYASNPHRHYGGGGDVWDFGLPGTEEQQRPSDPGLAIPRRFPG